MCSAAHVVAPVVALPVVCPAQVNAEGVFRYAYVPWFAQALQVLALSGVHGVAVDVWVSNGAVAGVLTLTGCMKGFGRVLHQLCVHSAVQLG